MHGWAAVVVRGVGVSACAGGFRLLGQGELEGCVICLGLMYGRGEVREILCGR